MASVRMMLFVSMVLVLCCGAAMAAAPAAADDDAPGVIRGLDPRAKPILDATQRLMDAIAAGQADKANSELVGGKADHELLRQYIDAVAAEKALAAAMDKKFGADANRPKARVTHSIAVWAKAFEYCSVILHKDTASCSASGPMGIGIDFARTRDGWRVRSLASELNKPDLDVKRMAVYTPKIKAITAGVEKGSIRTEDDALKAANDAGLQLWDLGYVFYPATRPTTRPTSRPVAAAPGMIRATDSQAKPLLEATRALMDAIAAGDVKKADALLAAEGKTDVELLHAYIKAVAAERAMVEALNKYFGPHPDRASGPVSRGVDDWSSWADFNSAFLYDKTASCSRGGPMGIGIEFARVGDVWKVRSLAALPETPEAHLKRLAGYTPKIEAITAGAEKGTLRTAYDAMKAIEAARGLLRPPLDPAFAPTTVPVSIRPTTRPR